MLNGALQGPLRPGWVLVESGDAPVDGKTSRMQGQGAGDPEGSLLSLVPAVPDPPHRGAPQPLPTLLYAEFQSYPRDSL